MGVRTVYTATLRRKQEGRQALGPWGKEGAGTLYVVKVSETERERDRRQQKKILSLPKPSLN